MHHPTERITHTTAFVKPVVEHWLEQEIAWWIHLEGSIRRPIAPWANALTTELHLAPCLGMCWWSLKASVTQCWVCWTFTLLCSRLKRLPTSYIMKQNQWRLYFLGGEGGWGVVDGLCCFCYLSCFVLFCCGVGGFMGFGGCLFSLDFLLLFVLGCCCCFFWGGNTTYS